MNREHDDRPTIRIGFTGFWDGFDPQDNFFTRLLAPAYRLDVVDRPDYLVYSQVGSGRRDHLRHDCIRIFFTGEQMAPDWNTCDWAFTFEHSSHPRHFRLPLWAVYFDPSRLVKPEGFDPAATLARVGGRMSFTGKPGAKPVVSRFVSLRVLEDGVWRIAESVVRPTQAAVLEELEWLVGTWKTEAGRGDEVEASFSRPLGDSCIVGRTTIKSQTGGSREVLQVIHADRASGQVKTWIFDSSGARAEGVVEPDGASYHQSLVGTPAETAVGNLVRWVQVISPSGDGRFTLHAIERSVDGVPVPDGPPLHFRKVR